MQPARPVLRSDSGWVSGNSALPSGEVITGMPKRSTKAMNLSRRSPCMAKRLPLPSMISGRFAASSRSSAWSVRARSLAFGTVR